MTIGLAQDFAPLTDTYCFDCLFDMALLAKYLGMEDHFPEMAPFRYRRNTNKQFGRLDYYLSKDHEYFVDAVSMACQGDENAG